MKSYVWWVRGDEHAKMCAVSAASVARADPEAERWVIVPEGSKDGERLKEIADVVLMPETPWTHLTKISCLAQFAMARWDDRQDLVFIDSDTIVQKPLPVENDMWLTWRRSVTDMKSEDKRQIDLPVTQTYNGGVWGVNAGIAGIETMLWMRERLRKMSPQMREWYGDQAALAELAGPPPESGTRVDKVRFPVPYVLSGDELVITKLPCSMWNYTPTREDEDVSDKGILHFKGGSRKFFYTYAKRLGL